MPKIQVLPRYRDLIIFALGQLLFASLLSAQTTVISTKVDGCAKTPAFALKLGISKPLISTADRMRSGLLMFPSLPDGTLGKALQLPSWTSAGRLGPFVGDERGNITVAPVPNVNTLENPPERQNWLYRVSSEDGQLDVFAKIAVEHMPSQQNPYGIIGLAYDCQQKIIYASTISGSAFDREVGKIVAIDALTAKQVSELKGVDAIGVGVGSEDNQSYLFIGSARDSLILKVKLNADGTFAELKPQIAFKLDRFNTQKARKIRVSDNIMTVFTTEFYYNLVAQTEFEQPTRQFIWRAGRWLPIGVAN